MGWTVKSKTARKVVAVTSLFLAIELLDELVGGVLDPAWPFIRHDLNLSYGQIGMVLAFPNIVSQIIDPLFGIWIAMGYRRQLMLAGGMGFASSLFILAQSHTFMGLLMGFTLLYPASGAFINVAQATLIELSPTRHERTMALWNLAGSLGSVLGPLVLAGAIAFGYGWQGAFFLLAMLSGFTLIPLWQTLRVLATVSPAEQPKVESFTQGVWGAIAALKQSHVLRWLILLQFSDLMLDGLRSYVALYFVDVVGTSTNQASLTVTLWLGVAFLGDFLMIPLLARVNGLTYLKISVTLVGICYPAFLAVPSLIGKYIILGCLGFFSAGWYTILKGQLYAALPGQSGAVITLSNLFGFTGSIVPLALGFLALNIGLENTLWLLWIGPITLLLGLFL